MTMEKGAVACEGVTDTHLLRMSQSSSSDILVGVLLCTLSGILIAWARHTSIA
jgi:hypothetical protein